MPGRKKEFDYAFKLKWSEKCIDTGSAYLLEVPICPSVLLQLALSPQSANAIKCEIRSNTIIRISIRTGCECTLTIAIRIRTLSRNTQFEILQEKMSDVRMFTPVSIILDFRLVWMIPMLKFLMLMTFSLPKMLLQFMMFLLRIISPMETSQLDLDWKRHTFYKTSLLVQVDSYWLKTVMTNRAQ